MPDLEFEPVRDRRPLAVQVYDRLHDVLAAPGREGTEVPTELELVERLGVSRTTIRQALALLEEDGVVERGLGRRRFVARPRAERDGGFALEAMIVSSAPTTVVGVARRVTPATRWSSGILQVDHGAELIAWESTVSVNNAIVASALELIPKRLGEDLSSASDATLLTALGPGFSTGLVLGESRLSSFSAAVRDQFDAGIGDDGRAVTLTQVLTRRGTPVYLAKHVIRLADVSVMLGAAGGR